MQVNRPQLPFCDNLVCVLISNLMSNPITLTLIIIQQLLEENILTCKAQTVHMLKKLKTGPLFCMFKVNCMYFKICVEILKKNHVSALSS